MNAVMKPALVGPLFDEFPAELRMQARWAPWRAVWNDDRKKYDKIPYRGLSTASTRGWLSFEAATAEYNRNPDKYGGLGYLLTGVEVDRSKSLHGATGLTIYDLDKCIVNGEVLPWAAEIAAKLDSYTEVSPSGNGLHIVVRQDIDRDWSTGQSADKQLEVYGGTSRRFMTITGVRLLGSPDVVRPASPGAVDSIVARYRSRKPSAEIEDLHLPNVLGDDELPDIEDLDLPPYAKNFLLEGPQVGDRSRQLFAASIALNQCGLTRQEVFSLLVNNMHCMEIAARHWGPGDDKAMRYMWKHHCNAGAARAEGLRQLDLAQFDMMDEQEEAAVAETPPAEGQGIADDFDVLEDDFSDLLGGGPAAEAKPTKREPFTPVRASAFAMRSQPAWIIKGFLPQAGLAVIYGASGSGKTFFTLDFAGAVAQGGEWRGLPVKQGRVVYVVAEGASGFQRRLAAYCQFHGIDIDTLDVWVIADVPNLLDKSHIKALHRQLAKIGPISVIVIDTYARVMAGGNENDAKDTGQAVAHCDQLHRALGAMVVLVHHSGKDAAKGARGSGALRAAADLEVEVIQTREYRAATVTKMKDGEDNAEYAFKLAEVVLGQDDEGDNITSCVAEARGVQPKHERKLEPKGDIEKLVFQQLSIMVDLGDGRVGKDALVDVAYPMLDFDPATDKKDRRKEAIKRAIGTLVSKNLLVDGGTFVELAQ